MSELSESPEEIDEDLKLVLPYAIPIKEREHLVLTIRALRKIHRFERLYELYMDLPCRNLPENPNELVDKLKKFFSIKKVTELQYLGEYKRKLLKFYSFDRMPPSYFQLSLSKPQLPNTLQELKSATRKIFSCNPKNSTDFRNYVNILRKHYIFRKISRDYFKQKDRLPEKPEEVQTHLRYDFQISDKNLAKEFLAEIQDRFRFTIPLPKSYISMNLTDKPELPQDANEISQLNLTISISSPKILVETNREKEKSSLPLDTIEITSYLQNVPDEDKEPEWEILDNYISL
ncbi:37595_t:CDS:2 [Gigaspora margarita]|uniref:37595_t:CDS:1 n=1 Tax=Gigaspora margarita TaxID=4874 RepID=A0ABN7V9E8_GIGMA|nr:37595_t:CDS:2 [Gigaspora margarita]